MKPILLAITGASLMLWGQTAHAGAKGGPKKAVERVMAYSTDTYRTVFRGGEKASILVVGDGDTKLRLAVYDENDNLIEVDSGTTCLVSWIPKWTDKFTIKVRNLGFVYNDYVLATN